MASVRVGIAHQAHGETTTSYLPLEEVRVNAWVVDVSSRIVLAQTFYNSSDKPTGRAKYVFPLPPNAAVCAFELELDDGSVIVGHVKETEEAAQTFARGVEQGKVAALVERVTDDVFTISIGSIPAMTRVTAHLTFVMDLLNEAFTDHIRLQLPMYVAERYGPTPVAIQDTSATDSHARVHINVDIQTSDIIHGIRSPTHNIVLRRYKERSGRKSQRRMSATWQSFEFLTSDFVITIHAEGLDKPRCFAEVFDMPGEEREGSTIALQLTLVPKFLASKIPSQEYIFVVDRSGSMQNEPIEMAKRTLTMLLRLLPSTQTKFNIFSFGSTVEVMWPGSRELDPASLAEAISHVASMSANLGGTEIPNALRIAFNSRALDRPVVVFLLTDGRIYAGDGLDPWAVVSHAIQSSSRKASVRLFVLGIGNHVSLDVCSKLARHGNGEALFAASAEEILGKCASLVNAGRSKNIESIDINWGDEILSPVASPAASRLPVGTPELALPPSLQQAPHSLTKIFSGIRFTVFAITSFKSVPGSIRLTTKLDGDPGPRELTVPVTKVKPFHSTSEHLTIPIVHTLGARRLITDLDDGTGPLPTPAASDALLVSEDDLRKAGIIRLGLTYHLISKHTSFVAVQKGGERRRNGRRGRGGGGGGMAWAESRLRHETGSDELIVAPTLLDHLINGVSSFFTSVFGFVNDLAVLASSEETSADSHSHHRPEFLGTYNESGSDTGLGRGRRPRRTSRSHRGRNASVHSIDTFTSLSSLEGSSCSSCWTSSRSPSPLPQFKDPIERAPSPEFLPSPNPRNEGITGAHSGHNATHDSSSKRHPIPQEIYDLFQQLNIDGSFTATPHLSRLVGGAVLDKADELGVDKQVWTTVVFVAYIKTRVQNEPDLLELMSEKAKEFVVASEWSRRDGAMRFEDMVRKAMAALNP